MKIRFLIKEIKIEDVLKRLDSPKIKEMLYRLWGRLSPQDKRDFYLKTRFIDPLHATRINDSTIEEQLNEFFKLYLKNGALATLKSTFSTLDLEESKKALALNWFITNIILPFLAGKEIFRDVSNFGAFLAIFGLNFMCWDIKNNLELFFINQRFVSEEYRDVMKVKDRGLLADLAYKASIEYEKWVESSVSIPNLEKKAKYRKIYEDEEFNIYIPDNKEAAQLLGLHTVWCTATLSKDKNMYHIYHEEDNPLFILISKDDPPVKYQFSFGKKQFMDKENHQIPEKLRNDFIKKYRKVFEKYTSWL